ncbi:MAG: DUF4440 domain-containing protein [Candidatus Krumholzibacteria bacterium]|jgi:ketosteroid isomerase-like protein|nr:DUF4440 domain-containing protein [Candidatus Krumholzibacteria bacterium]
MFARLGAMGVWGMLGGFAAAALAASGGSAPNPAVDIAALEADVRAVELLFAKTMADRNHDDFVSFLGEDAVFVGRGVLRGRDAVAAGWRRFFESEQAPFSWAPERVVVIDAGDLALSSGPIFDPAGDRVGTFNSVWRREGDGVWKIVLDNGCPACPER